MATTISVNGVETSNIVDFSISEDATPLRGGDNSGGVGGLSVQIAEEEDSTRIIFGNVKLTDSELGETGGSIIGVGGDELSAGIDLASRLLPAVVEVTAGAYVGTLGGAIRYYLGLADVYAQITIDPVTDARPVAFIGWTGVLWDAIKDLCIAFQIEASVVSGEIVMRQARGRVAENSRNTSIDWDISSSAMSEKYSIMNYNLQAVSNVLAYPMADELEDASVISLNASEVTTVRLQTGISLTSIVQPQITQLLTKYYTGPLSLYSVTDSSGAVLGAAEWSRIGGRLEVEIDQEDPSVILVHLRGGTTLERAPYRIGLRDGGEGSNSFFSALRIIGSGVAFREESIEIPTGVPAAMASSIDGPRVDNRFVADAGMAFNIALSASLTYAAPRYTINVSTDRINRSGETGSLGYTSYADFQSLSASDSYTDFQVEWNGKTYFDFREFYFDLTSKGFENQAMGNTAGARVLYRDCWFRIRSATFGPSSVSYTAESDTLFSDFIAIWGSGASYADFQAHWGNELSYMNFGVKPLWQD